MFQTITTKIQIGIQTRQSIAPLAKLMVSKGVKSTTSSSLAIRVAKTTLSCLTVMFMKSQRILKMKEAQAMVLTLQVIVIIHHSTIPIEVKLDNQLAKIATHV